MVQVNPFLNTNPFRGYTSISQKTQSKNVFKDSLQQDTVSFKQNGQPDENKVDTKEVPLDRFMLDLVEPYRKPYTPPETKTEEKTNPTSAPVFTPETIGDLSDDDYTVYNGC